MCWKPAFCQGWVRAWLRARLLWFFRFVSGTFVVTPWLWQGETPGREALRARGWVQSPPVGDRRGQSPWGVQESGLQPSQGCGSSPTHWLDKVPLFRLA